MRQGWRVVEDVIGMKCLDLIAIVTVLASTAMVLVAVVVFFARMHI